MDTRFEQPVTQMLVKAAALVSENNPEPKPEMALSLYTQAESVARLALGEGHPHRLSALSGMASMYEYFGEALVARLLCAELLARIDSADLRYVYVIYHTAMIEEQVGNLDSAERLFAQAANLLVDDAPLQEAALAAAERLAVGACEDCTGDEGPTSEHVLH